MLQESHLNVYIVGDNLSQRQRVQLQAQLDSALRALPQWCLDLVRVRLQSLGVPNFPLAVEPQPPHGDALPLSLGRLGDRPAAYLRPRLRDGRIDWLQDRRYLVAKAAAYFCAPSREEAPDFWDRWSRAVQADALREVAAQANEAWIGAPDADLLIETFAARALNPAHRRWRRLPAVRGFLEGWSDDFG